MNLYGSFANDPINKYDEYGLVVPVIIGVAILASRVYNAYGTAMDVKETWETWQDPCAGTRERLVSTAWTVVGLIPGGKKAKQALNAADSAGDVGKGTQHIRNAHLAGQNHPKTGIPFDKDGFPDFSSVSTHTVKIELTGNRALDDAAANRVAGLDAKPRGFTWHHHQDGTTMQLVPTDIHRKTGHTGGFALGG